MAIYQDRAGKTFETRALARASNQGTLQEQGKTLPPASENTINSGSLTSTPDFKITPTGTPTQGAGMSAEITSKADAFTQDQQQKREDAQKNLQAPKQDFQDFIAQMRGETGLTSDAYSNIDKTTKESVDTIQKDLNDINQQIRAEDRALQNQLVELDKNPSGLFGGALGQEKQRLTDESNKRKADQYVIQQGIQGKYDSAKAIADRAVSAYMEKQKMEYDALKFNYDENKDLFTLAEQREFDTLLSDRDRAIKTEEANKKSVYDTAIDAQKNGAPQSVVQSILNSKTPEDALKASEGYLGLIERQKLAATVSNNALDRRLKLFELAKAGDTEAMTELGIDPNAPDAKQKVKSQEEITKIDAEIKRVQDMLDNTTGLNVSAGSVQSPLLSSLGLTVPAGTALGAGVGTVVPGLGTLLGAGVGLATGIATGVMEYGQQRDAGVDFLSKANYINANLTIEKMKQLKADGVAFTPMTDKDVENIAKATAELGGSNAIKENGEIVGFKSEEVARRNLLAVQKLFQDVKDREYKKMVSDKEVSEIDSQ
jgi:hypothetical protein